MFCPVAAEGCLQRPDHTCQHQVVSPVKVVHYSGRFRSICKSHNLVVNVNTNVFM